MSPSLFRDINNAVLDLQSAEYQNFQRPLKRLAVLLSSPELAPTKVYLTGKGDLEAFLREGEATGGGMVGSQSLSWPDDAEATLGACPKFCV